MTQTGIVPEYAALILKGARMKHIGTAIDALLERTDKIDRMLSICDPPDFARHLSGHAHELAAVLDQRWDDLKSEVGLSTTIPASEARKIEAASPGAMRFYKTFGSR